AASNSVEEPPRRRHFDADERRVERRFADWRCVRQRADHEDRQGEDGREPEAEPGNERKSDAEGGKPEVRRPAAEQRKSEYDPADDEESSPSPGIRRGRREASDGSKGRHGSAQKSDDLKRPYSTESTPPVPSRIGRSERTVRENAVDCAGCAGMDT